VYQDGRGILRQLLQVCDTHRWQLTSIVTDPPGGQLGSRTPAMPGEVAIMMTLAGPGVVDATKVLATVDGVTRVDQMNDDSE